MTISEAKFPTPWKGKDEVISYNNTKFIALVAYFALETANFSALQNSTVITQPCELTNIQRSVRVTSERRKFRFYITLVKIRFQFVVLSLILRSHTRSRPDSWGNFDTISFYYFSPKFSPGEFRAVRLFTKSIHDM